MFSVQTKGSSMLAGKIRVGGCAALVTATGDNCSTGAIHLPGLPNSPFPIPGITEFLAERFFLLQPHYLGTYDSEGEFDPRSSNSIINFWMEKSGESCRDLASGRMVKIPDSWNVISSHSFGTYVLMSRVFSGSINANLLLFFAPMFSYGDKAKEFGIKLNLADHARFVESAFPLTFRVPHPNLLADFFAASPSLEVHGSNKVRRPIPVAFVLGEMDPMLDPVVAESRIRQFCEDNRDVIELKEIIKVPTGGHAVDSLMTDDVCRALHGLLEECTDART